MSAAPTVRPLPFAAVAVSVALWSTAYVASALVLETASPAVLSVLRFAVALVVLVPLAARRPGFLRVLRSPRTLVLGITGVTFYYSFANLALLFTTTGTAALANAALPVLTALFAVLILRERLPLRTVAGLLLAVVGVGLIAAAGLRVDAGLLLCLVALASYALYTVLLRRDAERATAPVEPLVLATGTAIWGTVLMLPWLAGEALLGQARLPADAPGILAVLFLGLVVTAPTMVLYNYGAERLPAAVSGIATAGIPAIGYALSLAVGEPLDAVKVVGGVVALAGIVVATLATPAVEASAPGALVAEREDPPGHASRITAAGVPAPPPSGRRPGRAPRGGDRPTDGS